MNERRRAIRTTRVGLPGDADRQKQNKGSISLGPRTVPRFRRLWTFDVGDKLRRVGIAICVAGVFALVIYVGAAVTYAAFLPPVKTLEVIRTTWTARGAPTFSPTITDVPTKVSTPTKTPTPAPLHIPPVPRWFTETLMIRYAGIVMGETWSITDTEAMIFIATQVMYDAERYKGKIPVSRWKAYKRPTHDALQAVNIALVRMLLKDPRYPKCDYIGGYYDGDYFARVSKYRQPDYSFGAGDHVVQGWGCIPESIKKQ